MTTWIFKGALAAIAIFTLTGCEAGPDPTFGLPGVSARGSTLPLSRASMTGGVVLVAPAGYCIDRASLDPRFAVMARCDMLGVPSAAGSAPRGLITVSLTTSKPGPLPTAQHIATATALQNVGNVDQQENQVTFRAQGRIPVGGLATTQWRGVARIGGQTAGIAVYGPERGEMIRGSGHEVLTQLIARSVEASPAAAPAAAKRN